MPHACGAATRHPPRSLVQVFSASADSHGLEPELGRIVGTALSFGVPHARLWAGAAARSGDDSVATLVALGAQDVVVGSKSGFSHLAAVYGPRAVHLGPPFTHPFEVAARYVEVPPSGQRPPAFDGPRFRSLVAARLAERCNACGGGGVV